MAKVNPGVALIGITLVLFAWGIIIHSIIYACGGYDWIK